MCMWERIGEQVMDISMEKYQWTWEIMVVALMYFSWIIHEKHILSKWIILCNFQHLYWQNIESCYQVLLENMFICYLTYANYHLKAFAI